LAQRSGAQGSGLRQAYGPRPGKRTYKFVWPVGGGLPARYGCSVRVLLQHVSRYRYPKSATLGPHLIRLRPAAHARARIETYGLHLIPEGELRWQQDPAGNFVARASWPSGRFTELGVSVELAVDIRPINPCGFTRVATAGTRQLPRLGRAARRRAAFARARSAIRLRVPGATPGRGDDPQRAQRGFARRRGLACLGRGVPAWRRLGRSRRDERADVRRRSHP